MIKSTFKFLFFVAAILLFGQIRVRSETIAARFQYEVFKVWDWGKTQCLESRYLAELTQTGFLAKWLPSPPSRGREKTKPPASRKVKPAREAKEGEEISATDRESLLRLIQ